MGFTNLELVAMADSWPYFHQDPEAYNIHMQQYWYFMVKGHQAPFGYMPSALVEQMPWLEDCWELDHERRVVTLTGGDSFEERTENVAKTLHQGIDSGKVTGLDRWRGETFPLLSLGNEHVLDVDRSGADIFGFAGARVHMIGYSRSRNTRLYWVPRRALTEPSYPGMLENTVGGSIRSGEDPIECIIRVASEEASLSPEFTRHHIKSCGVLSFQTAELDDGNPGYQAQWQYLYELELPDDHMLKHNDSEVREFRIMKIEEVHDALSQGEFKLNCAMTWIAYMIRHGYLTAENEQGLVEIEARLHRKHHFFIT